MRLNPTTFILNRIQRDASGKIKLGLDLQGGTAFLVEMDTNALANPAEQRRHQCRHPGSRTLPARFRRRWRCCASAWTSSAWPSRSSSRRVGNQILIQLPGLSEADKESAEANIKKAAYLEFRMVKEDSDEIIAAITNRFRRVMRNSSTSNRRRTANRSRPKSSS